MLNRVPIVASGLLMMASGLAVSAQPQPSQYWPSDGDVVDGCQNAGCDFPEYTLEENVISPVIMTLTGKHKRVTVTRVPVENCGAPYEGFFEATLRRGAEVTHSQQVSVDATLALQVGSSATVQAKKNAVIGSVQAEATISALVSSQLTSGLVNSAQKTFSVEVDVKIKVPPCSKKLYELQWLEKEGAGEIRVGTLRRCGRWVPFTNPDGTPGGETLRTEYCFDKTGVLAQSSGVGGDLDITIKANAAVVNPDCCEEAPSCCGYDPSNDPALRPGGGGDGGSGGGEGGEDWRPGSGEQKYDQAPSE